MNTYVTGSTIRQLREAKHLTQAELAEKLSVSAKTISKWETAKGLPDISQNWPACWHQLTAPGDKTWSKKTPIPC